MKRRGLAYPTFMSLVFLSFGLFTGAAKAQSVPDPCPCGPVNSGDSGHSDSSSDSSDRSYAPPYHPPKQEVTEPQPSPEEIERDRRHRQATKENNGAIKIWNERGSAAALPM